MIRVPLHRRGGDPIQFALIDDTDEETVLAHRWFFDGMYAATKVGSRNLRLHRLLNPDAGELEVDHINRDKLDCRRANMRLVTHAENCRNVPSQGGSSRHRGVVMPKGRTKWRAQARYQGRMYWLGHFDDETDAAAAVAAFWAERADVPVNAS